MSFDIVKLQKTVIIEKRRIDMNIFKFILNSKEPEVSRWDEVKIFLNLMVRPEQCSGIQEITKARRQKKTHKKLNYRIYMHKHK